MCKVTRQTFTITFTCDDSKMAKNGTSPVFCSLIINGERVRFQIPLRANPKDFKRLMISKKNNYIKDMTSEISNQIYDIQTELMRNGDIISASNIRDCWRDGRVNSYTLSKLWKEFLYMTAKRVGVNLTKNVYDNYDRTATRMIEYMGDKEVREITVADCKSLYQHWQSQYITATSGMMMQKVRTIMQFAIDKGIITTNPTSSIKISRQNREIQLMTEEEYYKLKNVELPSDFLNCVRDVFIFGANSGLAYTDTFSLTEDDIKHNDNGQCYISKKRNKTGVDFFSVVLPDGVDILEKYHNKLPKMTNQVLNRYIKEVMLMADIKTNLTCHLMRHYYITKLIRMDIPVSVVQKCAGHANISMTNRYTHLCKDDILSNFDKIK